MNSEDFLMDFFSDQTSPSNTNLQHLFENCDSSDDELETKECSMSGDDSDDDITMMMISTNLRGGENDSLMMASNSDNPVGNSLIEMNSCDAESSTMIDSKVSGSSILTEQVSAQLSHSTTSAKIHHEISPVLLEQSTTDGMKSAYRGYRNAIVTGVKIRIPYILQSVIYALIFQTPSEIKKVRFVIKQMFHHSKNLASFVAIYKLITFVCRNYLNVRNGLDALLAGFVGGSLAFGESKGISGAVNNQIVLYLFARGIDGGLKALATKGYIPEIMDISTPNGFRLFAGFSLALVLYLTDHQPRALKSGFMSTMKHLYHESNDGTMSVPFNFAPFVTFITVCLLLGYWFPQLRLENVLQRVDDAVTWDNIKELLSTFF